MVDDDTGIDPQLPILLRTLFEKGQEQETLTRGTGTGLGVGANSLSNLHLRHQANNPSQSPNNHITSSKQTTVVSIAEAMVSQKLARVLCRAGQCQHRYSLYYQSLTPSLNLSQSPLIYPTLPHPILPYPSFFL